MPPGHRPPAARRTAFARSVLTLASGTAAAQALLALALPLLTRLYTPGDYGALAVFSSTITVLLVVASLRYEQAIPLPEGDDDAGSLLALSLALLAGMAAAVGVLVWLAGDALVAAANVPALRGWLWLVPMGFAGAGSYQALSYWAIRRHAFDRLARTRVAQGVGQTATQLGLGALGGGAPGLLLGDLVGRVAGGGGLAVLALRERPRPRVTRASIAAVARRYRRFPLLSTWAGLFNVGSLQLPSIVFAAGFGAAAAGLYALSYKVLVLPTMLVAQAVGQVFLSRAAALARDPDELRRLTERTALALFAAGLPMFGAVGLAGPELFRAVMGAEWETAGRYAQVMSPWFAVWVVSNPLSGLLSVREWQGSALAFSAFELALRVGALVLGTREGSPLLAVALLSASGVIIAGASIARFLRAGHSSVARLLGPGARVLALAALCLLPAALALRASRPVLALLVGVPGVGAYYLLVLRMLPGVRLPWAPADAPPRTVSS
ncbi:MAG TPA: oligosaccharide flippase family protein [Gemmatimonadales bacterium]|nr:oligosaccharide flippase family protein [Gemmatimonadales bacterium]